MPFRVRPVHYDGWKFRSMTEARWAILLDTLNIDYMYEMNTFMLQDENKHICYLPDFYLTDLKCFLEIKNNGKHEPLPEEQYKAKLLAIDTEKDVYIAFGKVGVKDQLKYGSMWKWKGKTGELDTHYSFTQCPTCLKFDITKNGNIHDCTCYCEKKENYKNIFNNDCVQIKNAVKKSRSHQFC